MITDSIAMNILRFSAGLFCGVLTLILVGLVIGYVQKLRILGRCYICGKMRYWCEHRRRN